MKTVAFKNGTAYDTAVFAERAFMYADGFFETMRCRRGRVALFDYHILRIHRSAKALKIPVDSDTLHRRLAQAIGSAGDDAILKVVIGRAYSDRGSYACTNSVSDTDQVNIYTFVRDVAPRLPREGAALKTLPEPLIGFAGFNGLKLINRLNYIVASVGVKLGENEELLFVDSRGNVVETMHHNIFAFCDGRFITPKMELAGVRGVMREYLLDEGFELLNVPFEQSDITSAELQRCEEVFISNAVDGIVSVSTVDGYKLLGRQRTLALREKIHAKWDGM